MLLNLSFRSEYSKSGDGQVNQGNLFANTCSVVKAGITPKFFPMCPEATGVLNALLPLGN